MNGGGGCLLIDPQIVLDDPTDCLEMGEQAPWKSLDPAMKDPIVKSVLLWVLLYNLLVSFGLG